VNPGFESNSNATPPIGWTVGGGNPTNPTVYINNSVVPAHSGIAAVDLGPAGDSTLNGGWMEQTVTILTAGNYDFNFWHRIEQDSGTLNNTSSFQVDFTGVLNQSISLNSNNVYQQYNQTLSLSPGTLTLRFTDTQPYGVYHTIIDDVHIGSSTAAPEPGALGLLALGAVSGPGTVRRRRGR
jgi:hypothetical protein